MPSRWDDLALTEAAEAAATSGCDCAGCVDLIALVPEVRRVLAALVELLAAVNVATLEDPSKYRVANTCALAALVARDAVLRHGLADALAVSVRARFAPEAAP